MSKGTIEVSGIEGFRYLRGRQIVEEAAKMIGATPADIPGLWNAPGYPELTDGQVVQIASERS